MAGVPALLYKTPLDSPVQEEGSTIPPEAVILPATVKMFVVVESAAPRSTRTLVAPVEAV